MVNSEIVRWIPGVHFIILLYRRLSITCVFAGVKTLAIKGVQRLSAALEPWFPVGYKCCRSAGPRGQWGVAPALGSSRSKVSRDCPGGPLSPPTLPGFPLPLTLPPALQRAACLQPHHLPSLHSVTRHRFAEHPPCAGAASANKTTPRPLPSWS